MDTTLKSSHSFIAPIDPEDDRMGRAVVDAAYTVHRNLGPGLLESIYETCFCYELGKRGIAHQRQAIVPVCYDGVALSESLRLDVLVSGRVVCELKAVEEMKPLYEAQLLTYLKLSGRRLGFLINFNVPLIKQGIKRMAL
jgi:GxxExxY protein